MARKSTEQRPKMTAKQRSARAKHAADCRWNSHRVEKSEMQKDPLFARLLQIYSGRPMD